jgi:hypothetical protein
VRVAVASPGGEILPGYGLDDSQIRVQPDQVYTPVRWREKEDLAGLRGEKVELQFEIKGAVLYGYRFFSPA